MITPARCPECGAAIPADVLAGLCPHCAAKIMLGDSPKQPPRIRRLGDYELLEEIGRGGMGVVYRARQVSLNRIVAVKMLAEGVLASNEAVARFRAEAQAAANLRHPNIVAIHETGLYEGHYFFSMDYVDGPSLAELTADSPLSPARAARYVRILANTIHFAHQRGIVHRDLKPSNILVDAFDQPLITDFGLAKKLVELPDSGLRTPALTLAGQVLGSPSYIPPEQAGANHHQIGAGSDVYALGAILYHLLTGQPPFSGPTLTETLAQVQTMKPRAPRTLNHAIPRDLETICLKCLRKAPQERYSSAAELAEDLARWEAGAPVRARPPHLLERVWHWARQHPQPVLAGVGALLLAGTALIVWRMGLTQPASENSYPSAWQPINATAPERVAEHWPFAGATELIYVSANGEIMVTDPAGSRWFALPVRGFEAQVSPSGQRLCYARPTRRKEQVFVSRLDGTGEQCVAEGACWPRWLDDNTLLFQPPDFRSVWTLNLRTGERRKRFDWNTVTPQGYAGSIAVAPDRKRLLANPQNGAASPTQDLFVCDLEGRVAQTIWEDSANNTCDAAPIWLAGDAVAWCRYARPGANVFDMAIVRQRPGSTNYEALTDWKGWKYPLAASSDGQRILFVRDFEPGGSSFELWIMNADGTDSRRFANWALPRNWSVSACWAVVRPAGR